MKRVARRRGASWAPRGAFGGDSRLVRSLRSLAGEGPHGLFLRLRLAALGAPPVLLLAGCGSALAVESVSITIVDVPRAQEDWGYAPGTREIGPGTWVTWSNAGQDAHTVTALDGSFDSGNLDPSEGFAWYFDQPGTFQYICALHPWMHGSVVVDESVPPAPLPPDDGAQPDGSDAQP